MKDELIKKEKELQEQRQIDQKREKKSIWIFVIVIVIALMVGVGAGIIAGAFKGVITYFSMYAWQIREVLAIIVPSIMVCMNIGMAVVCFTQCRKLKRQIDDWRTTEEFEEKLDEVEYRMNIPVIITSIGMVLNFFLVAVNWKLGIGEETLMPIGNLMSKMGNIIFILSFLIEMTVQNKILKLEKELNPEKKGNIFDFSFHKEWLGSCDEAEKTIAYKSGFRAYTTAQYVCLGLWLFCIIGQFAFDTGILSIVCVTIIWLTLVCTYLFEHLRLEKLHRRVK